MHESMKALSKLIALEKTGDQNALRHYFAVGALVAEVQTEEGLSFPHQAAEIIAKAMIEADHGHRNPQHYLDAARANEALTDAEKALFIKRCVRPTHVGIYVRCQSKAKARLIEGLKAGAIVSRIFATELEAMKGKTGRRNWKDSDSVKPDAEQNPGDITIPVVVKRNYEVQHDSIIDGVCSVMTHLDGADRAEVWRDIEKRINDRLHGRGRSDSE